MNEIIKVNYDGEQPTISARDLHERLRIGTKFTTWFERMCEYGFSSGKEFFPKMGETSEIGGRPPIDYDLTIRCGKEICMLQRTEEGKAIREYLLDLEDAWNTPEKIMARALEIAHRTIEDFKSKTLMLEQKIEQDKPKTIFADAVSTSKTSILIGDLAKLICQNGVQIGQKRLFDWLRQNNFLIKSGSSKNMPQQRYVEQGLFEVKESSVQNPDGSVRITRTTKVTGKGQVYFVNKFLNAEGT